MRCGLRVAGCQCYVPCGKEEALKFLTIYNPQLTTNRRSCGLHILENENA
jgi:hypothetical protein